MSFQFVCKPLPNADPRAYHAAQKPSRGSKDFVMSRSELLAFAHCPAKWLKNIPVETTAAMAWGNLIDCLFLTPDRFETAYEVTPETYTVIGMKCPRCGSVSDAQSCKKCGTVREATDLQKPWNWNADHCANWRSQREAKGIEVVKPTDASEAQLAVANLRNDKVIAELMANSDTCVDVRAEWHDDATGLQIPFRCLLDIVPRKDTPFKNWLADLKTTADASPDEWRKTVRWQQYHIQAAVYLDAYNAATGEKRDTFVHPISENDEARMVARRMLTAEHIETGRAWYQRALKFYCLCLSQNYWPGYDDPSEIGLSEDGPVAIAHGDIIDGWRLTQIEP